MKTINTFSIAAYDPDTNAWGVAVASKFLACGGVVSWAKAGAGAIATQSMANLDYGQLGLKLLAKGYSAEKALTALLSLDKDTEHRQIGIVDASGGSAAFTGKKCMAHAAHLNGQNFSCQGNILASDRVIPAMAESFRKSAGLSLARRMVAALIEGEREGGDRRGKQAAGLLVVTPNGSYGGFTDRAIDLRVDDNPQAVTELSRLLDLHELYFGETKETLTIEGETLAKLQKALKKLGYLKTSSGVWDSESVQALTDFSNTENFEERMLEGSRVDGEVLRFMLKLAEMR